MQSLVRASLAGHSPEGIVLALDAGWQCRIFVLAHDLVRVLFVPESGLREPRTWAIAPGADDVPWEGRDRLDVSGFALPRFGVDAGADAVSIATRGLTLRVRLHPFGLQWRDAAGNAFAEDRPTQAYEWSARGGVLRHYAARAASHQYFGLGDKTGPLNRHGRRFRTLALDALGYDAKTSDPLYKHWPFLIERDARSGIAFGQFYDTLAPMTFDLGCEHDNYHGLYRYAEIEDGDLDYYVFPGPRIRDVARRFTELTGRMAFGPRWSLGYANTAMSLTDAPDAQARLAGFCARLAEHEVPCSAFHFGSGYTSIGKRRYVFTWNRDKFPQPREAVARFARQHVRTVVNLKPCLLDDHPAYADVAARGAFVRDARTGMPCVVQFWDGEGAQVDFTHPAGVSWWQDGLRTQVLDYGIDAGWNDNNEYEIWDDDGVSHGFGTPLPIRRSRPLHALLMTRATAEAQAAHRPGERVYTVTRAGPPGIQRYAQTWSGDNTTSWHTLRWNIRMGLGMSLSGMFNTGHDVGGFAGPVPDSELLIRWTQNGVFSPRFIMNSWKDGGEVNTPWLHRDALPAIRDAIRLRYRLMPYLYTLYRDAAVDGVPMMRPLFYEFDADARAFDDSDDFMLGPNLLVASIVEPGQRRRRVYLPRGPAGWSDFWTGERYAPATEIEVDAPLWRMPLFVPWGAIVPLTDSADFTRLHDEPSRQLRIHPPAGSGEHAFTLYEDDGIGLGYRRGEHAQIELAMTTTRSEVTLSATKTGSYALPYDSMRVVLPADERRRVVLRADAVTLHR
ncbi:MAG TPA: glycoside hydrolase family 31 protein [Casimicrobiaceae bacterium]|jgi:alpha-glucosidase